MSRQYQRNVISGGDEFSLTVLISLRKFPKISNLLNGPKTNEHCESNGFPTIFRVTRMDGLQYATIIIYLFQSISK